MVWDSIDFSRAGQLPADTQRWEGNYVDGNAQGWFTGTAGTGPRTPRYIMEVGKTYVFRIQISEEIGSVNAWYWDGSNNTNLGSVDVGPAQDFEFTCMESDAQW